jgi:hypothetical protein
MMSAVRKSVKLLGLILLFSGVVRAQVTTTQVFSGVTFIQETRNDPPLHLHVVQIDLSAPGIQLYVSRGGVPSLPGTWTTVLQTVRAMAERDQLDIAVNANFFGTRETRQLFGQTIKYPLGSLAAATGAAMTDGLLWSPADNIHPSLVVDEDGKVSIGMFPRLPARARQVVSGSYLLVTDGKVIAERKEVAPHTAVGIDQDGKRLTIFVVDGRRPEYSAGMDCHDVGEELKRLGCWNALNLDGGGSSTLVLRNPKTDKWQVMNRPSDGYQLAIPLSIERPVACALGVRVTK